MEQNMINEEQKEKHYTPKQLHEQFNVEYTGIIKACRQGKLKASTVPAPHGAGHAYLIAESDFREWYANRRDRNSTIKGVSEMTVEELADELMKRIKKAYDDGYKQGRKDQRDEMLTALKGVK